MKRIGLFVGMAALLVGCDSGADSPPGIGEPFPEYAAPMLDGDTVRLSNLRGEVVLLNVWATWCPPCRREMPALEQLHRDLKQRDFQLVGVSIDAEGSVDDVRAFVQEIGVTYTILHDPASRIIALLGAPGIPATYLIDGEGRLVAKWLGEIDPSTPSIREPILQAIERSTRR